MQRNLNGDPSTCTIHISIQFNQLQLIFDLCNQLMIQNRRRAVHRLIDVHTILRRFYSLRKKSTSQNNNRLRIEISKKGDTLRLCCCFCCYSYCLQSPPKRHCCIISITSSNPFLCFYSSLHRSLASYSTCSLALSTLFCFVISRFAVRHFI